MKREVKLSSLATKKLDELLEYLLQHWSQKVKNDFIKKLDSLLVIIQLNFESFPQSKLQKGLYKCVVTKQTTMYYRIN